MFKELYTQNFFNFDYQEVGQNFQKKIADATKKLRNQILNQELEAINIIDEKNDIKDFADIAVKITNFEHVLLIGVGGSSLGAKTICSLSASNKIQFVESIDPSTLANTLKQIDLAKSFFLVVSKSGETIETLCQTLIIIEQLKQKFNEDFDFSKNFLFITSNKHSAIGKIAYKIKAPILNHPADIGGRYSVFCAVGILPAIIANLNVKDFRIGAKKTIEEFLKNEKISQSCAIQIELYQRGFRNNVFMPYSDNLKNFTDWYRQLLAESLGKNGYGATPINSMGTVDQHSQLQLYLEGFHDKFFTFISAKKNNFDFVIKDLAGCETLFGNKKLSQILQIEKDTTIEVLKQKKLPIRVIEINKIDELSLGALMMQMFLEIILIAYALNINPFDQPAVELRKDLAKKILANFYE